MYAYYHNPGCGKPAFLLTEMPSFGAVFTSAIIRHLDGSKVEYGAPVRCESCGLPLAGHPLTTNVREVV